MNQGPRTMKRLILASSQFGNDCLCFQLRRAARLVTEVYDDEVGLAGLSIAQFALLARLDQLGEVTQTEVAEHLTLDPTTLTRTLTPLVTKGFITKARGTTDARARHLQLTPEGRARLRIARPQWRVAQDKLKKALGDDTWFTLHGLLKDVSGACVDVEARVQPARSPAGPTGRSDQPKSHSSRAARRDVARKPRHQTRA
jgi:DNA-binding MarR family transcriptional regulator